MPVAMRSPAGEVLEVPDEFAHALRPLGWEPVQASTPADSPARKAPTRRSPRTKKEEPEEG